MSEPTRVQTRDIAAVLDANSYLHSVRMWLYEDACMREPTRVLLALLSPDTTHRTRT